MKRAILPALVVGTACALAACGSGPGDEQRTSGTSWQDPPPNPNAPPFNTSAPPANTNAPPDNPNAPPDNPNAPPFPGQTGQIGRPGGGGDNGLNAQCRAMCDAVGDCARDCRTYCAVVRAGAVNCAGQAGALLACARNAGLSCDGNTVVVGGGGECTEEYSSLITCASPPQPTGQ